MIKTPGYSRTALAKASGPCSTMILRQPSVQGYVVSSGTPLGSSRLASLGMINSVLRPGSPYCKVYSYSKIQIARQSYDLTFDRTSIDRKVSKVSQKLLRPILTLHELKEVWSIINKLRETIKSNRRRKVNHTVVQVFPPIKVS